MTTKQHWQGVYETKASAEVSWHAAHLEESLQLIAEVTSAKDRIIDVGAGASTLVDDLIAAGYRDVTLLDVAEAALDVSRRRLGANAATVTWLAADVTEIELEASRYELWHDRAVFHFLTDASDRRAYVDRVRQSVTPGGYVVIGTFSSSGPAQCSGLDVVRYDAESLGREFGRGFELTSSLHAVHLTPAGRAQNFIYCRFTKATQSP
ncbi:MAG: hypothetical protein RJA70_3160 [Pseudomonadota bacterium]|jgi:2-polyprenyl-3-methyl-5-hydroxy-6-metoxy-1,4-benzoquinol methylase